MVTILIHVPCLALPYRVRRHGYCGARSTESCPRRLVISCVWRRRSNNDTDHRATECCGTHQSILFSLRLTVAYAHGMIEVVADHVRRSAWVYHMVSRSRMAGSPSTSFTNNSLK